MLSTICAQVSLFSASEDGEVELLERKTLESLSAILFLSCFCHGFSVTKSTKEECFRFIPMPGSRRYSLVKRSRGAFPPL